VADSLTTISQVAANQREWANTAFKTSRADDRLWLSNTSWLPVSVPTTQNEIEVGDFIALLVDDVVPVDGFNAHAPAQALPCLFRQLGQEGVQEHQDDWKLIHCWELIRCWSTTAQWELMGLTAARHCYMANATRLKEIELPQSKCIATLQGGKPHCKIEEK